MRAAPRGMAVAAMGDGARGSRRCCVAPGTWLLRMWVGWTSILFFIAGLQAANQAVAVESPVPNLGLEGRAKVELPRADYRPRPLDDRTELILRLENVEPGTNGQFRYDFYFLGLEPGHYRLADYLVRPDGSRPDELSVQMLEVRGRLPEDHDGRLNAHVPSLFPFIGGYRAFLAGLAALWVGGLAAYIYWSGRKPTLVTSQASAPPKSLAERLRPLVEAAAAGRLGVDGQAQLERYLIGYWREKLTPPELRMAESVARLKTHQEAGALLRALERWLHRPGGVAMEEISALLQPYREVPVSGRDQGDGRS